MWEGPQSHSGTKIKMEFQKNKVAAQMKGLECLKRSENLINRKMGCFYIEAIPQKISKVRKQILFFEILKKKLKKLKKNCNFLGPKPEIFKIQSKITLMGFDWILKFYGLGPKKFQFFFK